MTIPTNTKTIHPLPKPYKTNVTTVETPGVSKVDGETIPRRNAKCIDALRATPHRDISTAHDIIGYAAKNFGNNPAIGSRKLIKLHHETKKVKKVIDGKETTVDKSWQYFELSGYSYMSFVDFEKLALQIGRGLRKLGMEPGDKLHLFAQTHPNWLASAHGAMSQSMPIVTAYDTLSEEAITLSMRQTRAKAIYIDPHLLKTLINPLKEATDIINVVYNTGPAVDEKDIKALQDAHPHLQIMSFEELRQLGEQYVVSTTPPKPDDLCCIMYTSGTTGTPKGVLLKHGNVVAAIAGLDVIVGDYLGPGDKMLTYLPLAHSLEFTFENAVLFWGGTMGYGNYRTISDANMRNCAGDMREFKPTILIGVPAVWEQIKKGIINKVNSGNFIIKNLFWGAMAAKEFLLSNGLPGTGILDAIVFNKVREATGGKLRICLTGGGPIAKDTLRFISNAIAVLISGYGLTETMAMGVLQDPLWWDPEALGEIPGCAEIKLVDFPDAGYHASSNPPQGEIWIRGSSVCSGYLDLEQETKESFTDDGWFKTGDIGEWAPNGQLRIIDRKKNLVKTLNGEYIALEKLESIYRSDSVVLNICVYADTTKVRPVAIIIPIHSTLKKMAQDSGVHAESFDELIRNERLNTIVLKQLQATGRAAKLKGIEVIEGVVLTDEEWTPQNGLVTSAQKLNRKNIVSKYLKDIDHAYKKADQ